MSTRQYPDQASQAVYDEQVIREYAREDVRKELEAAASARKKKKEFYKSVGISLLVFLAMVLFYQVLGRYIK